MINFPTQNTYLHSTFLDEREKKFSNISLDPSGCTFRDKSDPKLGCCCRRLVGHLMRVENFVGGARKDVERLGKSLLSNTTHHVDKLHLMNEVDNNQGFSYLLEEPPKQTNLKTFGIPHNIIITTKKETRRKLLVNDINWTKMDLCTVFENHPKTSSAIGCLIDHETIKDIGRL